MDSQREAERKGEKQDHTWIDHGRKEGKGCDKQMTAIDDPLEESKERLI